MGSGKAKRKQREADRKARAAERQNRLASAFADTEATDTTSNLGGVQLAVDVEDDEDDDEFESENVSV